MTLRSDEPPTATRSGLRWALLADALTGTRLLIAAAILTLAFTSGARALSVVFGLTLLAWTTDLLDGNVARRGGPHPPTRLARWDMAFDIVLMWATLTYAIAARLLHPLAAVVYPLCVAVVYLGLRSRGVLKELNTVAHAVTFGAVVLGAPALLAPLLAWGGTLLLAFRRRAVEEARGFVHRHFQSHREPGSRGSWRGLRVRAARRAPRSGE